MARLQLQQHVVMTGSEQSIFSDPRVVTALVAAGATVLLALLKGMAWLISGPRERRRAMYVEALEHALDWKEMPHRLRRRSPNDSDEEKELRERFHDLQEKIERARGRIGTESGFLARSYCRLVRDIKTATQPYIQRARENPVGHPLGATAQTDRPPNTDAAQRRFLLDVRLHLSLWPIFPRLLLAVRNLDKPDPAPAPLNGGPDDPALAPADERTARMEAQ